MTISDDRRLAPRAFGRRTFVAALAGASAAVALPRAARSQAASGAVNRIDVHRHVSPPFYVDEIAGRYGKPFPPPLAAWTPERCLADMDAAGIATGMLSMPARPGMYFGDVAAARKLCRDSNAYMADLRRTHPGRFGVFAALPLPDVASSLAEVAYAFDQLHVDGVGVWSSYGATYLGDASFNPLWAELDRRKAVVFSHPTDSACCVNPVGPTMSETVVEFAADTTRTIGSLVFSGASQRYPNIRFIFSHGGGATPYLVDRFHGDARDPKRAALLPHGVDAELRRFYYDTAFVSAPAPMAALMKMAAPSHILLGTDYPYAPGSDTVNELAVCGATPDELDGFERRNALALFPRA